MSQKNTPSENSIKNIDDIDFQTVAEDAPVMLWLTNNDGNNIFTNSKFMNFIGREKVENLGGKAWFNALHPEDRKHCLDTFRDAFESHKSFVMEYRMQRRDGEYRYILDRGEPYINSEGRFSGFIGSSTDISDRKQNEDEIKKSHEELMQYNLEMRLINQLNSYLQVCRTLDETYPVISHYASKIFPGCAGALYLFNDNKTLVESVTEWGGCMKHNSPVISPDDCWSLRQGREHIVRDSLNRLNCKHLDESYEQAYTCVPVIAQGEMLGMLHLEFTGQKEFDNEEDKERYFESRQRLVKISADNLALSLVSLKLREALKNQSVRDPLTKLYNRRYMEESLEREMTRCQREQQGLGIIMLDIDHFKKFNDNYGHDAGDIVLVDVAKFLTEFFRSSDIVCRFGGEEFIIIMPNVSEELVQQRAEEICEDLRGLSIIYSGKPLPAITASLGVSHMPTHGTQSNVFLKAADSALYKAKNEGRDQVMVAPKIGDRRGKGRIERIAS